MKTTSLSIPKMFADHHVQAVRDALLEIPEVEDVYASSMRKLAIVSYNGGDETVAKIISALQAAGYTPGEQPEILDLPKSTDIMSPWFQVIERYTQTNLVDLELSGDFRKY